jgi:hypothetical protein
VSTPGGPDAVYQHWFTTETKAATRRGTAPALAVVQESRSSGGKREWMGRWGKGIARSVSQGRKRNKMWGGGQRRGQDHGKEAVSKDIPVQNIQPIKTFQYKIFSQ